MAIAERGIQELDYSLRGRVSELLGGSCLRSFRLKGRCLEELRDAPETSKLVGLLNLPSVNPSLAVTVTEHQAEEILNIRKGLLGFGRQRLITKVPAYIAVNLKLQTTHGEASETNAAWSWLHELRFFVNGQTTYYIGPDDVRRGQPDYPFVGSHTIPESRDRAVLDQLEAFLYIVNKIS